MAKLTKEELLQRRIEAVVTMPRWLAASVEESNDLDEAPSFAIPEPGRLTKYRSANGGVQACVEFPNGYEASVVRHSFSYGNENGLWELAVRDSKTDRLVYDTPITNDVIGHLSDDGVTTTLREIAALPPRTP